MHSLQEFVRNLEDEHTEQTEIQQEERILNLKCKLKVDQIENIMFNFLSYFSKELP